MKVIKCTMRSVLFICAQWRVRDECNISLCACHTVCCMYEWVMTTACVTPFVNHLPIRERSENHNERREGKSESDAGMWFIQQINIKRTLTQERVKCVCTVHTKMKTNDLRATKKGEIILFIYNWMWLVSSSSSNSNSSSLVHKQTQILIGGYRSVLFVCVYVTGTSEWIPFNHLLLQTHSLIWFVMCTNGWMCVMYIRIHMCVFVEELNRNGIKCSTRNSTESNNKHIHTYIWAHTSILMKRTNEFLTMWVSRI